MAKFAAKIKLNDQKNSPLTHVGFRGRSLKKGESFTTSNPDEAAYYQSQPGFSVVVVSGKQLAVAKPPKKVRDPDPPESDDDDEDDEDSEDEEKEEVDGSYEKADLKKMSTADLKKLIEDDDDLSLSVSDLPKRAGKKEIIEAILEAQAGGDDEDEEENDEEDEDDED